MARTQLPKLVAVPVTGSHLIPVIHVGTEREDTDEVTARHTRVRVSRIYPTADARSSPDPAISFSYAEAGSGGEAR